MPTPFRHTRSSRGRAERGERGQSLVEFSLILGPLLLLLLGIIQFGFVFNTYVTVSTAAREAARQAGRPAGLVTALGFAVAAGLSGVG